MSNKSNNIDCIEVEKILFQSSDAGLSEKEMSRIKKHIKSCSSCQKSQNLLQMLKPSMQYEIQNNTIMPDPAIKKSIMQKLYKSNVKRSSIIELIKSFFDLKIPVYQVITALLILGGLTLFLKNTGNEFKSLQNNVSIIAAIDSNTISMQFQNSLQWLDSLDKGQSISEDTVLASFIQSSM